MSSKASTAVDASASAVDPAADARVRRAGSVSESFPATPPDGCYRCQQEIYISFFFDGFAQTLQDGDQLSNIGKLYTAHALTDPGKGVYKLYYEGMGRKLSTETTGIGVALAKNGAANVTGVAESKLIMDPSKKAATETAKQAWKDWPNPEVGKKVKSSMLDAFSPKKIWEELKKPATAIPLIVSSGISVVADSVPLIRDSEIAAGYMGTGFNARVEQALNDFKTVIARAKADPRTLKTIRVSVFGYDRGGVTARKFTNDLIGKTCKQESGKVTYEGVDVQFDFMGLFDCVSSAYADSIFTKVLSPVLTFVPGEGWIAKATAKALGVVIGLAKQSLGQFDTSPQFKKVLHYVAATELRFYKNLDSPRGSKDVSNLTEVVYPGSQSDVGGGFKEGEDEKSAELARVSARNMLDQGWSYGVPFRQIADLKANGLFTIVGEFEFKKTIAVNGKSLTVNDLFGAYTAHLGGGTSSLENHLLAHQKLFVSWARYVHDRTHGVSQGDYLFVNTIDANVYNAIFNGETPNYETREANYERISQGAPAVNSPWTISRTVGDINDPTVRELATAWVKPAKLSPEVIAFFDNFVHNTITRLNNVSLGDGVFMQLRTIDDRGAVSRTMEKGKDILSDAGKKTAAALREAAQNVPPGLPPMF